MLDSGLDIVDVQHLLHHSTPVITQQRYAPCIRKDLIEKGARIDNILTFQQFN
jgi:integrase